MRLGNERHCGGSHLFASHVDLVAKKKMKIVFVYIIIKNKKQNTYLKIEYLVYTQTILFYFNIYLSCGHLWWTQF